jgi:hypothetical protein
VSGVTIYMEGGGDSAGQKAQLGRGMQGFLASLKENVTSRRWRWRLVACGSRREAYEAFVNERKEPKPGEIIVLLVDSEAPVTASSRAAHLRERPGDGWDLNGVPEKHVHFMIQTMETWIVADPEALAAYYGQHFQRNSLPSHTNLEEAAKADVADGLKRATEKTKKGAYQKIKHASDLLKSLSEQKVRARCPACERMFADLSTLIEGTHS